MMSKLASIRPWHQEVGPFLTIVFIREVFISKLLGKLACFAASSKNTELCLQNLMFYFVKYTYILIVNPPHSMIFNTGTFTVCDELMI